MAKTERDTCIKRSNSKVNRVIGYVEQLASPMTEQHVSLHRRCINANELAIKCPCYNVVSEGFPKASTRGLTLRYGS